jgi:MiaB/RimO family radical SAM methylthiotransferase
MAKGGIFSYPSEMIVREISSAMKFGAKEFWLTGQDVSAYGLDEHEKSALPSLLESIAGSVPGRYMVRVGMVNPRHAMGSANELLRAFRHDNVFKFLHLPVQSGSNRVLGKMNRGYSAEDFVEIVEKFRRHFPQITIWTDIIAGFPGEENEDFELTTSLIRETMPDFVNVSQFSCHPKTPAAAMLQVSSQLKKERSSALSELARKTALEKNMKWIGWEGEVLVDEYRRDRSNWIGRNFAYKPVAIKTSKRLSLGSFVKVRVAGARATCLIGELCDSLALHAQDQ